MERCSSTWIYIKALCEILTLPLNTWSVCNDHLQLLHVAPTKDQRYAITWSTCAIPPKIWIFFFLEICAICVWMLGSARWISHMSKAATWLYAGERVLPHLWIKCLNPAHFSTWNHSKNEETCIESFPEGPLWASTEANGFCWTLLLEHLSLTW